MPHRRSLCSLAGLGVCAVLGLGVSAVLAVGPAAAVEGATSKPTKITATLSNGKVKLTRTSVAAGTTVLLTVRNTGTAARVFRLNGKATPRIKPGSSSALTIKFNYKTKLSYVSLVPGHLSAATRGTFTVAAPVRPTTTAVPTATSPTVTGTGPGGAVTVTLTDTTFSFAPVKIPSGDVTFVVTNTGTTPHNLDIKGVTGGVGPVLVGGQSATMTVNLTAGVTYTYQCDQPGHANQTGTFVPSF